MASLWQVCGKFMASLWQVYGSYDYSYFFHDVRCHNHGRYGGQTMV